MFVNMMTPNYCLIEELTLFGAGDHLENPDAARMGSNIMLFRVHWTVLSYSPYKGSLLCWCASQVESLQVIQPTDTSTVQYYCNHTLVLLGNVAFRYFCAAWHRGRIVAFHPAVPGLIFSNPKNFSLNVAKIH